MNSKIIYRYLDKMKNALELTPHIQSQTRMMALILDKHGTMISKGENSYYKSHPEMLNIKNLTSYEKIFLHAEIDACIKGEDLKDKWHTLIVVRIDANGKLKLAKPCENCSQYIKGKFTNVYYSDNKENLVLYKELV